jgi:hypothetical protein
MLHIEVVTFSKSVNFNNIRKKGSQHRKSLEKHQRQAFKFINRKSTAGESYHRKLKIRLPLNKFSGFEEVESWKTLEREHEPHLEGRWIDRGQLWLQFAYSDYI